MYQGKYGESKPVKKHKRRTRKPIVAIISLVAILVCMVGGTIAYLVDSQNVTNSFEKGYVTCYVEDVMSGQAKTSIKVQNTGNTPARIRVRLVANWVDSEGYIYGGDGPVINVDYNKPSWEYENGYLTCQSVIQPGDWTPELLNSAITVPGGCPAGYHLEINVLADAIQANGQWNTRPAGA